MKFARTCSREPRRDILVCQKNQSNLNRRQSDHHKTTSEESELPCICPFKKCSATRNKRTHRRSLKSLRSIVNDRFSTFDQWWFLVPLIGGRYHRIPYKRGIYCQLGDLKQGMRDEGWYIMRHKVWVWDSDGFGMQHAFFLTSSLLTFAH